MLKRLEIYLKHENYFFVKIMGIETPGMEQVESPEKQGVIKNLAEMLGDRTRGFIDKAKASGIAHPGAQRLAMVGALMAAKIGIANAPDFDLLTAGGLVDIDTASEAIKSIIEQAIGQPESANPDVAMYNERWDNPGVHDDVWTPTDPSGGEKQQVIGGINPEKTAVDPNPKKPAIEWLEKRNENPMENPTEDGKRPFGSYPDHKETLINNDNKNSFDAIKEAVEEKHDSFKTSGAQKTSFKADVPPETSFKADVPPETSFKADVPPETSFKADVPPEGGKSFPESEGQNPVEPEGETSEMVDTSLVSRNGKPETVKMGKVVQGETPETVDTSSVSRNGKPETVGIGKTNRLDYLRKKIKGL